jgi:flagellum-specific peptidoglycan hydrolase FlgJ
MNHFYNTFGKTNDWGCFVYRDAPEKNDVVDAEAQEQSDEDLSKGQIDKMDKAQESRNYQKTINKMIEHLESEEAKEAPEGFGAIPASEFLNRTQEELKTLFVTKEGAIDFHGNEGARRYVGMGDLFVSKQRFIKMNGIVGKRSIANGKVGYVDKGGSYLAIFGGEKIDLDVSESEQSGFESIQEFSAEEEGMAKDEFKNKVEQDEKALEEMRESMRKLLSDQGLSKEEIDNMGTQEMFGMIGKLMAQQVEEKYGIPWEVCLAQSALESGYGKKALGNNFFGVKAMGNYAGKTQEFLTTEYWGDKSKASKMVDKFRAYDSIADSFNDYGQLLSNSSRYAGAFQYKHDPRRFLETVIASGYATDPNYVSKAEGALRHLGYSLNNSHESVTT